MTEWTQPDQAERFVRTYADPILRVCAAWSLRRADAQDICQDIFLTLLVEQRSFDSPGHERAFVLRCAINACKDILKSSRFRRTAPLEEAERVAAPVPGEEHPVWQAVEGLPPPAQLGGHGGGGLPQQAGNLPGGIALVVVQVDHRPVLGGQQLHRRQQAPLLRLRRGDRPGGLQVHRGPPPAAFQLVLALVDGGADDPGPLVLRGVKLPRLLQQL